jgi:hypothetical protein
MQRLYSRCSSPRARFLFLNAQNSVPSDCRTYHDLDEFVRRLETHRKAAWIIARPTGGSFMIPFAVSWITLIRRAENPFAFLWNLLSER